MNIQIKPQIVKTLRERRALSIAKLAQESTVSIKQIRRIESTNAETTTVHDHTATQLASALRVTLSVLKGEKPIPKKGKARDGGKTKMKLDPGLQVLFDLIEERYKIRESELIALAPLLFTILAEASIIWHRQRSQKLNAAMYDLHDIDLLGPLHHADENSDSDFHGLYASADRVSQILQEIDEASLFSDVERRWNPFAAYLNHLTEKMRADDAAIGDDRVQNEETWKGIVEFFETAHPGDTSDMPVAVLDGEFNKITNGNSDAGEALWNGDIRIRDIPRSLFSAGKDKERGKFIAKELKQRATLIEMLKNSSPEEVSEMLKNFEYPEETVYKIADFFAEKEGISRAEAEEKARQFLSDRKNKKEESNND